MPAKKQDLWKPTIFLNSQEGKSLGTDLIQSKNIVFERLKITELTFYAGTSSSSPVSESLSTACEHVQVTFCHAESKQEVQGSDVFYLQYKVLTAQAGPSTSLTHKVMLSLA